MYLSLNRIRIGGGGRLPSGTPPAPSYDPDAQIYINNVELQDGQPLETGVKDAMNTLIVGLKSDGILQLIHSCCLFAGPRTLNGALVQLIPNANPVTNINFIPADHSRPLGIKGNNINKSINTNRNTNADPRNSNHVAAFVTQPETTSSAGFFIGSQPSSGGQRWVAKSADNLTMRSRCMQSGTSNQIPILDGVGFIGTSRDNGTNEVLRFKGSNATFTISSEVPGNELMTVFRNGMTGDVYTDARISFFSIGEALLTGGTGLALLETRITTYMNTLAGLNL